ncbi:MAG: GNAT family N-acetyltransferase [Shimia sp.]|uniref:N-acetyltransferase family protein n=1 Tax=Shimia sp. TaxID=1954381 RepID=UPI00405A1FB3
MSQISIQRGGALDLGQAAELLNEIIKTGGTTALTKPLTRDEMAGWLMDTPDNAIWHIAVDQDGKLLGFQCVGPFGDLPPEACEIATFVKQGRTGLGIGSKLFDATKTWAKAQGFEWINAEIRADNDGGLAYYQSRGFENYKRKEGITLTDGTVVAKVFKRFTL